MTNNQDGRCRFLAFCKVAAIYQPLDQSKPNLVGMLRSFCRTPIMTCMRIDAITIGKLPVASIWNFMKSLPFLNHVTNLQQKLREYLNFSAEINSDNAIGVLIF